MSNTAPNYMFGIMGACVVGIVGAAGMFIYEKVLAEKKRRMLCESIITKICLYNSRNYYSVI